MEKPFDFADERRWSDARILTHFHHLRHHLDTTPLANERKKQVYREITHVAFEGLQREQFTKRREEEIAWLDHSYNTTYGGDA